MAYCTQADIQEQISEAELLQLTDDEELETIDTSVMDRAIADADAEINTYCGMRYALPLDPVPAHIRKQSVSIAIYNLFVRRGDIPDAREASYNNAIKFLEKVAKNLVSLGVDDPDSPPSDAHKPEITHSDRVFSRDKMSGF